MGSESIFVKICGITSEEDALLATALDADALGFVFAPSRRQVQPEAVRDIVKRLPSEILTVGVFRDERPERVVDVVGRCGLHAVQLHGSEPVSQVRWIRERVQFVIQAFAAGDPALAAAASSPADVVLVDSPDPGSGLVFDWRLADGVPRGVRLLLAGGLTPENVAEAIHRVRPWGVDVSTGVESAPGCKDARKLRRFIEAVRSAVEGSDLDVGRVGTEPVAGRAVAAHRSSGLPIGFEPGDDGGTDRPYDWQIDD